MSKTREQGTQRLGHAGRVSFALLKKLVTCGWSYIPDLSYLSRLPCQEIKMCHKSTIHPHILEAALGKGTAAWRVLFSLGNYENREDSIPNFWVATGRQRESRLRAQSRESGFSLVLRHRWALCKLSCHTDISWGFLICSYLKYILIWNNTANAEAYAKPMQWLMLKSFIGSQCQKFNFFFFTWPFKYDATISSGWDSPSLRGRHLTVAVLWPLEIVLCLKPLISKTHFSWWQREQCHGLTSLSVAALGLTLRRCSCCINY